MIKREDAKEKFTDFIRVPSMEQRVERIHRAFDKIYDSIGSCGECKHEYNDYGCPCKPEAKTKNFYCADFERKQNDS